MYMSLSMNLQSARSLWCAPSFIYVQLCVSRVYCCSLSAAFLLNGNQVYRCRFNSLSKTCMSRYRRPLSRWKLLW